MTAIAFAYNAFLGAAPKLGIILAFLITALLGYFRLSTLRTHEKLLAQSHTCGPESSRTLLEEDMQMPS